MQVFFKQTSLVRVGREHSTRESRTGLWQYFPGEPHHGRLGTSYCSTRAADCFSHPETDGALGHFQYSETVLLMFTSQTSHKSFTVTETANSYI